MVLSKSVCVYFHLSDLCNEPAILHRALRSLLRRTLHPTSQLARTSPPPRTLHGQRPDFSDAAQCLFFSNLSAPFYVTPKSISFEIKTVHSLDSLVTAANLLSPIEISLGIDLFTVYIRILRALQHYATLLKTVENPSKLKVPRTTDRCNSFFT